MKTYHPSILQNHIIEWRCGPSNQYYNPVPFTSATSVFSLLKSRLSQFGRTGLDIGRDGDCFFRAVSHKFYGNPKNHFHVHNVGIQ